MLNSTINVRLTPSARRKMEYTSKSQIARIETEKWAVNNLYCPLCGNQLQESSANTKVYDFICSKCNQEYQLKSLSKKIGKKLIGSEYYTPAFNDEVQEGRGLNPSPVATKTCIVCLPQQQNAGASPWIGIAQKSRKSTYIYRLQNGKKYPLD